MYIFAFEIYLSTDISIEVQYLRALFKYIEYLSDQRQPIFAVKYLLGICKSADELLPANFPLTNETAFTLLILGLFAFNSCQSSCLKGDSCKMFNRIPSGCLHECVIFSNTRSSNY